MKLKMKYARKIQLEGLRERCNLVHYSIKYVIWSQQF